MDLSPAVVPEAGVGVLLLVPVTAVRPDELPAPIHAVQTRCGPGFGP